MFRDKPSNAQLTAEQAKQPKAIQIQPPLLFGSRGGGVHIRGPSPTIFGCFRYAQVCGESRYLPLNDPFQGVGDVFVGCVLPAGYFDKMILNVIGNTINVDTTCTLRKNGVNTLLAVTVPALSLGIYKTSLKVEATETDYFNYRIVTGGIAGVITLVPSLRYTSYRG